jgi:Hydantoinase/oxoprolinase N-terminal region/Hydantoinase/oxoprolinase
VALSGTVVQGVVMDGRDRLLTQAVLDADDPTAALSAAIDRLLASPDVDGALVTHVVLGTGQALTRALEDHAVDRVAVIRIGSPLTGAVPPLAAWPLALREAVSAGETVVAGGAEYDGSSPVALDEDEVARFLDALEDDVGAVAVTGVFSPVAPEHEQAAAALVRRVLGHDVHVSLSHELGSLGLIERENATVLNAALTGAARQLASLLEDALRAADIAGEAFVTQDDGAVMTLELARQRPVLMLDTGPANALRGAVHLSGVDSGVVVHAGAGVTEVGAIVRGLPTEAASPSEVGGVRIGFCPPEIRRLGPNPDSAALAAAIGWARNDRQIPLVVAVGPKRSTVPDGLPGIGLLLRPPSGEVAAAVGAAVGEVTGRAERVSQDRPDRRREALEAARAEAMALAAHAGADPDRLQVVSIDETPLTYDIEPVLRICVKVAGPPA